MIIASKDTVWTYLGLTLFEIGWLGHFRLANTCPGTCCCFLLPLTPDPHPHHYHLMSHHCNCNWHFILCIFFRVTFSHVAPHVSCVAIFLRLFKLADSALHHVSLCIYSLQFFKKITHVWSRWHDGKLMYICNLTSWRCRVKVFKFCFLLVLMLIIIQQHQNRQWSYYYTTHLSNRGNHAIWINRGQSTFSCHLVKSAIMRCDRLGIADMNHIVTALIHGVL